MHKSVSQLPPYGLTCQILESLAVAQAQLGDSLTVHSKLMVLLNVVKITQHMIFVQLIVPHTLWECVMFFQGQLVIRLKHLKKSG